MNSAPGFNADRTLSAACACPSAPVSGSMFDSLILAFISAESLLISSRTWLEKEKIGLAEISASRESISPEPKIFSETNSDANSEPKGKKNPWSIVEDRTWSGASTCPSTPVSVFMINSSILTFISTTGSLPNWSRINSEPF